MFTKILIYNTTEWLSVDLESLNVIFCNITHVKNKIITQVVAVETMFDEEND